ncbi:MAG: acyltransferase [Spirosomataceae bacterium]
MRNTQHLPQLDTVRAIAIGLVLLFHWFPENHPINRIPNGPLGVTLFFVLSGFLITQILLKSKSQLPHLGQVGSAYRIFLIRRALRIFPIYYLTLLVIWLLPHLRVFPAIETDLYQAPLYYVSYLYNFWLQHTHHWGDLLSPYWSLAVEEQFYVFYPLVLLFVPARYLSHLIIGMIAAGLLSRGIRFIIGNEEGVLTITCLDTFGFGAWWALKRFENKQVKSHQQLLTKLSWVGGLVFLLAVFMLPKQGLAYALLFRFSMALLSLLLVVNASQGIGGWLGMVFEHPLPRYIGKISYGLYVYHMIVPSVLMPVVAKIVLKVGISLGDFSYRFISLALLIGLASLSWYLVEKPFNNLKQYFSYS